MKYLILSLSFFMSICVFNSCTNSSTQYSPAIGFVAITVGNDTLKFFSDQQGHISLDTIYVGDTVNIQFVGEAYSNYIQKITITEDEKKRAKIVMPSIDSIIVYPTPANNADVFESVESVESGIMLFKSQTISYITMNIQYVPLQENNDAVLSFYLLSDTKLDINSRYLTFKTPIKVRN